MAQEAGVLRVVTPDELATRDQEATAQRVADAERDAAEGNAVGLRSYITGLWHVFRDHRSTSGLDMRLIAALRCFNGQYDPATLAEIRRFGGSQVYGRVVANKCRGATSLLRDIYFSAERPWSLEPTPDPEVRADIMARIPELVQMEVQGLQEGGQPVDEAMVAERMTMLQEAAREAAARQARKEALRSTSQIDDYLREGEFYTALAEMLVDLPLFPYSCIKGPFVRMQVDVHWENGKAVESVEPRLVWERVSPFDLYFTPGAATIGKADVIQRLRWTLSDLNDLIDLPGWDQDAVVGAIEEYQGGLRDWMDPVDSERAHLEGREDPGWNRSDFIDALEFHGMVKGSVLQDIGLTAEDGVTDSVRSYMVQAWICGRYLLKVQVAPSPRKRHPYYVTSFEKVPGTPAGNALPDVLEDVQQVANAALRSMANNMALASGPQVVILDNRFSETTDTDELYPWKRWHMIDEPGQGALPPVNFFQPGSNAQELLGVYQKMTEIADEISAIPRYLTGSGAPGGAGRTASGLSMLLNNASKMLQQVASNIDLDILKPNIEALYDMLLLMDTGDFRGDENIVVKGASMVMAREADRARQLEFLQITANPLDSQIVGIPGRAAILRSVSQDIGLDGERIVPSETELANQQKQVQIAQQQQAAQAQGDKAEKPAARTGPAQNSVQTRNLTGGGQ